ncbi:MAG: hypothetical protein WAK91_02440 [Candidatus Acidiferrales bacterium]
MASRQQLQLLSHAKLQEAEALFAAGFLMALRIYAATSWNLL